MAKWNNPKTPKPRNLEQTGKSRLKRGPASRALAKKQLNFPTKCTQTAEVLKVSKQLIWPKLNKKLKFVKENKELTFIKRKQIVNFKNKQTADIHLS